MTLEIFLNCFPRHNQRGVLLREIKERMNYTSDNEEERPFAERFSRLFDRAWRKLLIERISRYGEDVYRKRYTEKDIREARLKRKIKKASK